jgi:PPOX class probable F420-dependent enzyme
MALDTLPDWAAGLVTAARVARLGYLDGDDWPRVLPVTFAVADGFVWSAIDEKPKRRAEPARVGYLRRRPEASLLVDDYDDDWTRLAWVQFLGDVTIEAVDAAALEALQRRYPAYRERPPGGPLLKLRPERVLSWRSAG